MLIDSHCHLDAPEFGSNTAALVNQAKASGVECIVVPAVHPDHFEKVRQLSIDFPSVYYAVGIHPMYVSGLSIVEALTRLTSFLTTYHDDPKLLAVGEIGLDGFVQTPTLSEQIPFFTAQLKLAKQFDLPVILHNRKAVDLCCKYLKEHRNNRGIFHAFNGSFQQAEKVIELGFCLGFGGTLTFERSRQIRRLATRLPEEMIVLETDAPDIPPSFLQPGQLNEPQYLLQIAETLAQLRQTDLERVALTTRMATRHALPRLSRQVSQLK
jgi:TatD DNase family protein